MVDVMALQADFESELKEMQNLQKDMKRLAESRQQLIEQQSECEIVKKVAISFNLAKKKKKNENFQEVDLLEESAKVFKLIGNVLVKQSTKECKTNVDKRIEFISKEM